MIARLKPLLEARHVLKIAQNVKFDWHVFAQRGIEVAPFDDTMLMSYALDSGVDNEGHGMDGFRERWLGHKPIAFSEVAGSGRSFIGFARVAIDKATEYAAEDADVTLRLWRVLKPRLVAEGMTTVYETLERPLVVPLARMEGRGVSIDREILSRLSGEFAQGMARIEAEIQDPRRRAVQSRLAQAARRHSVRPDGPAGGKEDARPAPGRPPPACSKTSPKRATFCRAASSTGASSPSSNRPIPTRCRAMSIRRRIACTRPSRWPRRRRGGCPRRSRICRTFPCATRRAGNIRRAFVARPGRASSSPPITARSSCGCSPISPTSAR